MNNVLAELESVAVSAVGELRTGLGVNNDTVSDRSNLRTALQVLNTYGRLYGQQTARAKVAVQLAGALGLKKDELLPVWKQLNGAPIEVSGQ